MNAVEAGGRYYYLFRGDILLPKGLVPLSPMARRLIWQGYTLEDALAGCSREFISLSSEYDREGLNWWKSHLMIYTEIDYWLNPFVSSTCDLLHALLYATDKTTSSEEGYVSVLRVEKSRFMEFRAWLDIASTQVENEFGLVGSIRTDEILFQVPVKVIDFGRYSAPGVLNHRNVLDFIETYGIDEYRYKAATQPDLKCPACEYQLSPYDREVLGGDSNALNVFEVPQINEQARHSTGVHLSSRSRWENIMADGLAKHGMIARCNNCRTYACLPDRIQSRPLRIMNQSSRGKHIFLTLRNDEKYPIREVTYQIVYEDNGKTRSEYYHNDLTTYSHTSFDEEFDILISYANKIHGSYEPIQPGSLVLHEFDLSVNPDKQPGFKIVVFSVHFSTGKSWLLPDWKEIALGHAK